MGSSVMAAALDFWTKNSGQFFSRWLHVVVGVAWIGLLYFFNFVQVPAFAEMEPAARNNAMDKLTWRALWWFRWAAVATVVTGFLLFYFTDDYKTEFMKTRPGDQHLRRDPARAHHVPERVGRDLAQAEDRDRQRPQRAGRRRSRSRAPRRRAARASWRRA